MTCILAIDPGLTGAMAFYYPAHPDKVAVYDMPLMFGQVNPFALRDLLRTHKPEVAIIEDVSPMPKEGVRSVWTFASATAVAYTVVAMENIRTIFITPGKWKRLMSLKGGKDGKEQARARAIETFPSCAEHFKLKKHHGRAEAALLAVYASTLSKDYYEAKGDHDADRLPTP